VLVLEALTPEDQELMPMPGAFSFGDLFRHWLGLERIMVPGRLLGRRIQTSETLKVEHR